MHLTPKDLNFVGYTYKNFDAVKALRHSSDHTRGTSAGMPSGDSMSGDPGARQTSMGAPEETDVQMIVSTTDDAMSP
ncbi:UNVERIFIED_CONTAM: hypothetical protein Sradi_6771700 [Sesamum radiatum]|uniref:Uncharacterized protein n=1 Tax=Sesamum radiatum TaxID=300843 RepID=A0AAW2JRD7_SESRA